MTAVNLTLFPDGEGYMENVWDALSDVSIRVLMGWEGARSSTFKALVRRGLIDPDSPSYRPRLTSRGAALAEWARATGRADR